MSILSLSIKEGNPVTSADVVKAAATIGAIDASSSDRLDDWTFMMANAHDTYAKVMNMPDYLPHVDEERFPRRDVRRPSAEENPLNAWAWMVDIKDTKESSKRGLLSGKVLAIKDNVTVKGVPCLLGTDVISDWVPQTDATIVTRILEAGGHIKGKAVCENLSLFGASFSAATGPVLNPHAHEFSAGGSSSGTAALIASGVVDMGIGGDQGGSIRLVYSLKYQFSQFVVTPPLQPASHTGIVGLKPTFGLVPYTGIASLEASLDHTGPLARTVLDCALLLQAIAGADHIDDRQQAGCPTPARVPDYPRLAVAGAKGLRVGILKEALAVPTADPRVSELVLRAAERYREMGATVEELSVPSHLDGPDLWLVIARISAAQSFLGNATGRRGLILNDLQDKLLPWTQDKFDKLFITMKNTLLHGVYGTQHFPGVLGKAINLVRKLRDEYDAALDKVDVLIMPTVPWAPVRIAPPDASPVEQLKTCVGLTFNTCPTNMSGHPSLSIPVGLMAPLDGTPVKLPVGMQIVGRWWDDATVLRAGHAWETANEWKTFA